MTYYISLLGAPGSGKGTQSELLKKHFPDIIHFSTGDIIRSEIKKESPLGIKVKSFLKEGLLVPDDVIIELFENAIDNSILNSGIISDGFPRTKNQALSFLKMFDKRNYPIVVLSFDISLDQLMDRLLGRLVCPNCSSVYHLKNKPPIIADVCDKCNHSPLSKREDDNEKSIKTRFDVYQAEIQPIKEILKDYIVSIDANRNPDEVFKSVLEALSSKTK